MASSIILLTTAQPAGLSPHFAPLPTCPDWLTGRSCHRTYRFPFLVYLTCQFPQCFSTKLQGDSGAVQRNAGVWYQFPDIHTVCSGSCGQRRALWSQPFQKKCEFLKLNCKQGKNGRVFLSLIFQCKHWVNFKHYEHTNTKQTTYLANFPNFKGKYQ